MDIRWLADTSFVITASTGTVVTDPPPGSTPDPESAAGTSIVVLSHAGAAHEEVRRWTKTAQLLDGPGEYEISGLGVRGVATALSDIADPQALNTVFVIDAEGLTVCHLGVVAGPLTAQAVRLIGKVDILLTPAGGTDQTLSADQAAAIVRGLEPRVVIPMHPGIAPGSSDLSALDPFVSELGAPKPEASPRTSITRNNLGEVLRLVLLRPVGA